MVEVRGNTRTKRIEPLGYGSDTEMKRIRALGFGQAQQLADALTSRIVTIGIVQTDIEPVR